MDRKAERTAAPDKPSKSSGQGAEKRTRMREILGVLARHGALQGMTPEKLRAIVEELGPTFVKLGQILSMRQDMLPAAYCLELRKLRADVAPLPFSAVRQVLEEEYGAPLKAVFASMQETPLGSASIAQVHAAVLKDGTPVVVKVQRPGIRDTMSRDIVLLRRAAGILKASGAAGEVIDFRVVLDEMWAAAQQEMDFLLEAANAEEFRKNNEDINYVACPRIIRRHSTSRVLMMEHIRGIPIDAAAALEKAGYDRREIGEKLAENYVKQILEDAFFHADPHPGNLRIRDGKIVWLDLGMMGRLTPRDQEQLKKAVKAVAGGDVSALKEVLLTLGVHSGPVDHARLYTDIDDLLSRYGSMGMKEMDLGRLMEELLALAGTHRISMPPGVTMLGRGIVTIQGVLADLEPELSILSIMANHLAGDVLRPAALERELKEGARALLLSGRRAMDLPAQLSELLKMTVKGQSKVNLELTGSEEPLRRADRMVNRLVLGLIIAALLIGSALLCGAGLEPRLWGMPLPAAVGFGLAGVLGGCLLWSVFRRGRGR